jgi:hypothetical protein
MTDPILEPYMTSNLDISSVPYFSPECGMTFKMAHFEEVCDAFWQNLASFRPRRYVENHLSLELSGRQYLAEYARIAQPCHVPR